MRDVSEIVKDMLVYQCFSQRDNIYDHSNIRTDLDLDSLDIVELLMTIEDEFDIDISDEDAEILNTFGDVVEYIEKRLDAK